MRTPLKTNDILELHYSDNPSASQKLRIKRTLGMGANVIAYEAEKTDGSIRYVLKECFPEFKAARLPDGTIDWKDPEAEEKAKSRMRKAYIMQLELQRNAGTENTNTHLADTIFEANGTLYTLTDHKNAETYDRLTDKSLQEIMITARAVARAVKAYHDAGFLHLDIKPQNIMIMPETRDMILLLDFDSIVRKEEAGSSATSYSPAFAAPEQLQGRLSKISEATDIYAIGALIYSRIFGKTPDTADRSTFSTWDFSGSDFYQKLSHSCRSLTENIFRKTLATCVKCRYASMDELIYALDEIITESNPAKRFLNSTVREQRNIFLSREKELREIHKLFSEDNVKTVFLTGIGGMGKTEIALRYASAYRHEHNVICFGKYTTNIKDLVADRSFISIEHDDAPATINSLRALLSPDDFLIIDNFDSFDDDLDELLTLNCKFLITTRLDFTNFYPSAGYINVGPLEAGMQTSLFNKEYGKDIPKEDSGCIGEIIGCTGGNTLLITLLAKICKRGCLPIKEMAKRIRSLGIVDASDIRIPHHKDKNIYSNISTIMGELFNMSKLTEKEHYVMGSIAILDAPIISKRELLKLIGNEYCDAMNMLLDYNWLQPVGAEQLTMHKAIYETYISVYNPNSVSFQWVKEFCDETVEFVKLEKEMRGYKHPHLINDFYGIQESAWFDDHILNAYYYHKAHQRAEVIKRLLSHSCYEEEKSVDFVINYYGSIANKCKYMPIIMADYLVADDTNLFRIYEKNVEDWNKSENAFDLYLLLFVYTISHLVGSREDDERLKEYVESEANILFSIWNSLFQIIETCSIEDKRVLIDNICIIIICTAIEFGENLFYIDFPNIVDENAAELFREYGIRTLKIAETLSCECISFAEKRWSGRKNAYQAFLEPMSKDEYACRKKIEKEILAQEEKINEEMEKDWYSKHSIYSIKNLFNKETEEIVINSNDNCRLKRYQYEKKIYQLCEECEKLGFTGVISDVKASEKIVKESINRETLLKAKRFVDNITEIDGERIKACGYEVSDEWLSHYHNVYMLAIVVYLLCGDEKKAEQQLTAAYKYTGSGYFVFIGSTRYDDVSVFLEKYDLGNYKKHFGLLLINLLKEDIISLIWGKKTKQSCMLSKSIFMETSVEEILSISDIIGEPEFGIEVCKTILKNKIELYESCNFNIKDASIVNKARSQIDKIITLSTKIGDSKTAEEYKAILNRIDNPLEIQFS